MRWIQAAYSAALLLAIGCHPVAATAQGRGFTAKTDARGFIDVWLLRRDAAKAEADYISPDPDLLLSLCSYGQANADKTWKEAQDCEKRVKDKQDASRRVVAAFNHAWLPVIRRAMALGDPIAEVILRDCETTPVLDRSDIESTCDEEAKRDVAIAALRRIGFQPAIPMMAWDWKGALRDPQGKRLDYQRHVLAAMQDGALGGFDQIEAMIGGNGVQNEDDYQLHLNSEVITAVLQDAPRAFTYVPPGNDTPWHTNVFGSLRLVRRPLTPGVLTWGRDLYSHAPSIFTGYSHWRTEPLIAYDATFREVHVSGPDAPTFRRELASTLAVLDASIDSWLRRDPRWGVFLLHRVGHHEWVPQGMRSTTGNLNPVWAGHWRLVAETLDWSKPMQPAHGDAIIEHIGSGWQISETATHPREPFPDVDNCVLRYSGGLTYLPDPANFVTALGNGFSPYLVDFHTKVLAALDPRKRYRQVLMECKGAESADSDRVRFLLHARNRMLEISADPVAVRLYRLAR